MLMADGSSKPIEQVKLGDVVLATDPATGRTEARAVTATWVHDNEFTRTESTGDTDGSAGSATATIEATDWHPFWVADGQECPRHQEHTKAPEPKGICPEVSPGEGESRSVQKDQSLEKKRPRGQHETTRSGGEGVGSD
ncbi:hypothetical protein [Kibdelosporangium phytohabitans]|uniref:Hint domain-containing protein n=1 Tax=Kibdelosporangium phytohabitans TaxID=860235 RepID=A0A0N7F4Q4_9PSEU|nr:hypothetical protein [Kibdelosporangium phytohabitans]ALG12079.1 hypothetical protein AOZ06_39080 [Kibdelosporangium phytohabitans]MBE1463567.1 hypothetical protein [Kibdelosporangium phytohabitans]